MLLPSERLITNFVRVVQLQRPMFRLTANLGRVLAANGSQGDPKANNLALARVGRSVWTASVPLSLATSLGGLITQRSSVQIRPGI
jgi:hypothetical protein